MEQRDILDRLENYSPPDRTVDEHRQASVDIWDAAAEIRKLRGFLNRMDFGGFCEHCDTNSEIVRAANSASEGQK